MATDTACIAVTSILRELVNLFIWFSVEFKVWDSFFLYKKCYGTEIKEEKCKSLFYFIENASLKYIGNLFRKTITKKKNPKN